MQRVKRRVLQALLVPLLLIGSVVAVQSPAYAACAPEGRHIAFLGYQSSDFERNCTGLHNANGFLFEGFRARYWSGWFTYTCPPNHVHSSCVNGFRTFCNWDYVQFGDGTFWNPITGRWEGWQIHYSLDEVYLNATKPASCP